MSRRTETHHTHGTKRARAPSPEDMAVQQPRPKRRVQAEFVAPQEVRMRVTQRGIALRIERTNLDPAEDVTGVSWLATTPNQGFIGQGTTDLIRRQLDLIDALAPGTMLGFAMHPATKPNVGGQTQREASTTPSESAAADKSPIMEISPSSTEARVESSAAPPSPERPVTPVRRVRPPQYNHTGSPKLHLSPDYPSWFRGWDALERDSEEEEWEQGARNRRNRETQRVARAERAARRRRTERG